jgi:hypothetical protein
MAFFSYEARIMGQPLRRELVGEGIAGFMLISRGVPHNADLLVNSLGPGFQISARRLGSLSTFGKALPGMGADFFVGGLFQLGEDVFTHPELLNDPWLLTRRFGAAGVTNLTTGLIGVGGIGALGIIGISITGWPAVVTAIGIAALADLAFGDQIRAFVFEKFNANTPVDLPRNLAPLAQ